MHYSARALLSIKKIYPKTHKELYFNSGVFKQHINIFKLTSSFYRYRNERIRETMCLISGNSTTIV
jgi:uncharacterized protein (UPF0332 family)